MGRDTIAFDIMIMATKLKKEIAFPEGNWARMKRITRIIMVFAVMLAVLAGTSGCVGETDIQSLIEQLGVTYVPGFPGETPSQSAELDATDSPSLETIEYDRHECELLRSFLDAPSMIETHKNGELLSKNYNSADPSTWSDKDIPFIEWTDDGHVKRLNIGEDFISYPDEYSYISTVLNFTGGMTIEGFSELEEITIRNSRLDGLTVKDCAKLSFVDLSFSNIVNVHLEGRFIMPNDSFMAKEIYWKWPSVEDSDLDFELNLSSYCLADLCVSTNEGVYSLEECEQLEVNIFAYIDVYSEFFGWEDCKSGEIVLYDNAFELFSAMGKADSYEFIARYGADDCGV